MSISKLNYGGRNIYENTAIAKINEIIDVVNKLQKHEEQHLDLLTELNEMRLHQNEEPAENVQDKFAEQRKWIGKLCKFWDNDDTQQLSYGVLTKIDTETGFGVQYCCNDEYDYDDCQPVKPDDDIIYRGE
jgi:hypothetical protein